MALDASDTAIRFGRRDSSPFSAQPDIEGRQSLDEDGREEQGNKDDFSYDSDNDVSPNYPSPAKMGTVPNSFSHADEMQTAANIDGLSLFSGTDTSNIGMLNTVENFASPDQTNIHPERLVLPERMPAAELASISPESIKPSGKYSFVTAQYPDTK